MSSHALLPSVVLTSQPLRHVLQGIALGYRIKVTEPSFFTFVESADATSPSTRKLGLVASALSTLALCMHDRSVPIAPCEVNSSTFGI